ncbi:AMP-binding protein [bacterium]|nr:AMP-binding protein [bacterium]
MNNLYRILQDGHNIDPEATAILFNNNKVSYDEVREASARMAHGLRSMGLTKGDRMALMLPNVPHYAMCYFALLQLGITVLALSSFHKAEEIHHRMEDAEVKGIIFWEGFRDEVYKAARSLEHCRHHIVLGNPIGTSETNLSLLMETHEPVYEVVDVDPDDTALIVYTAGATGRPNGTELTHANILFDIEAIQTVFNFKPGDKVLAPVPFYHPLGNTVTMGTFLHAGGCLILVPKFEASEIVTQIETNHPDYMVAVPSIIRDIVDQFQTENVDFTSLKSVIVSGEALKPDIMQAFETRYQTPIIEGYGLTEASPMVSFNSLARERKAGSLGLPMPGIDMKIVDQEGVEVRVGDVGEVIVKGPNVMKGYLNRPQATKETVVDGWLHTGDLALLHESGYGFIVVHKRNVIMKSGFSVYPMEVEKYLLAHPKISETIIVGLPDEHMGEDIHAAIILKEGETAEPEEILAYSRQRLANYKCPKTVHFFNDLPKGPNGRVLRENVREMVAAQVVK